MKLLLMLSLFALIPILSLSQNIENKLGTSGTFVIQSSDGIPVVIFSDNKQMTTVGRTTRLITGNQAELGSVYLDVLENADSHTDINLNFIAEPPVGTEHLLVVKDMKDAGLHINLLGNIEENHQWISSDTYFDLGGENMVATINDLDTGFNNQITYGATVTPPGTIIKVIYLGNNLWTASSSFLSTYTPPANE